jgi:hypothetical protein
LIKTGKNENIIYSTAEICPVCGIYTPEGNLCVSCQKEYGLYEPKAVYIEGVC